MKCPKCKGEVPTENIDRGDDKKRGTCPHCGATFSKSSRRAGHGRRPVFEVEGGGLDIPWDDGPGRDPLHDPMRILGR